MRLWSLDPMYLDTVGLGGCWREALGAQAVLHRLYLGQKPGYRSHSALQRFLEHPEPLEAICAYLWGIWDEAYFRGFNYNDDLILKPRGYLLSQGIPVTEGQVAYEQAWLLHKLAERSPGDLGPLRDAVRPRLHRLFYEVPGEIEPWERVKPVINFMKQVN